MPRMTIVDRFLSLAVLVAVVYLAFTGRSAGVRRPELPQYRAGEKVDSIDGLPYNDHEKTVVLFLSSQCKYCLESLPFYRSLVEVRNAEHKAVAIAAISRDSQATFERYISEQSLRVDRTATVSKPAWPKMLATPTMVVVDHNGIVLDAWVGLMSTDRVNALTRLLELRSPLPRATAN